MSGATSLAEVVVTFGHVRALDGLTLDLPRGEVTALLGPNGAGKSTTVAVLAGLVRPDSGTAMALGSRAGSAAARARTGVMLQEGGLPTGARGPELVRHIARLRGGPTSAGPVIDRLGIAGFARTTVRRMSGGQRRRVALACALVASPDLVMLDEPSAGLDPEGREQVWSIVDEVRARGATLLLSTHDLAEAETLGDRVAIVHRGRVVAAGTPAELAAGAEAERIAFLAALHLPLAPLLAALPDGYTAEEHAPGSYRIAGPPDQAIDPRVLATVTAWCTEHGSLPREMRVGARSLAEVYAEATRIAPGGGRQ